VIDKNQQKPQGAILLLIAALLAALFVATGTGCTEPDPLDTAEAAAELGNAIPQLPGYQAVVLPEVVTDHGAVFVGSYRLLPGVLPADKVGQVAYLTAPSYYAGMVWVRGVTGWAYVQGGPPWQEYDVDVETIPGAIRMAPILCEPPKVLQ
jgi:hypothetical protein